MVVNAFLQLCISNSTLRTEQHLNNVHWEHCLWMQVSAIVTETKTLWQSQPLPISVHWAKGFGRDLTHCLFITLLNIQLCTSVLKNWKMALENSKNYEIACHLFQWPVFPCIFFTFSWQFIFMTVYIMKFCKGDFKDSPCLEWCMWLQRHRTVIKPTQ